MERGGGGARGQAPGARVVLNGTPSGQLIQQRAVKRPAYRSSAPEKRRLEKASALNRGGGAGVAVGRAYGGKRQRFSLSEIAQVSVFLMRAGNGEPHAAIGRTVTRARLRPAESTSDLMFTKLCITAVDIRDGRAAAFGRKGRQTCLLNGLASAVLLNVEGWLAASVEPRGGG